jgi:hypothetical protein
MRAELTNKRERCKVPGDSTERPFDGRRINDRKINAIRFTAGQCGDEGLRAWPGRALRAGSLLCLGTAVLLLAGCGGAGSNSTSIIVNPSGVASMPTPPAPASSNAYIGSQGPGVWSLSLDDSKDTFSYQPVTFPNSPNTPVTGSFQAKNGFLSLGTANGASLGYVLEVPGRMALLRPGDSTASLVVSVPQTTCYTIPYRLRFEFVGMQAGAASPAPPTNNTSTPYFAYGSFVVNTDTSGSSWQFQDLQGSAPYGPSVFTGACAATSGQATTALSGEGLMNQFNYGDQNSLFNSLVNYSTTFEMGPSGIFILDQSNPSAIASQGQAQGAASAGVAQPSAPLSTSAVAAGTYLGFLTEGAVSGNHPVPALTSPVSFGQTASSGSTMTGGAFPNDDVTQTPNSDMQINLGTQDSTINGFYASARITTLDPNQNCATYLGGGASVPVTPGINAQGYFTCTYPATAVVGTPDGKYAIFVNTYNFTANSLGAPMQIYLYQQ